MSGKGKSVSSKGKSGDGTGDDTGAVAEHFDVIVVGAGLSGIGAAWRLRERLPGTTFTILEARGAIGGTWDLFRYPGVRSDSDMFTLSYPFRPWTAAESIAAGDQIRSYIEETAEVGGITSHIRFGAKVTAAAWSSETAAWTLTLADGTALTCDFVYACTGYYDYATGYQPDYPGLADFTGQLVHPQFWPAGLDYSGRRVVVIGSGATAVTLVPAMAATAAHVTMLQRSPSYVTALPERDAVATALRSVLPLPVANRLTRTKNILLTQGFYQLARRRPRQVRRMLRRFAIRGIGDASYVDEHFNPRYDPWDQRLCVTPAGDLYAAIRSGRASVVTDQIDTFVPSGIRLASGRVIEADVVVSATGLSLLPIGGVALTVDGRPVDLGASTAYRGMMLGGVPNLAYCIGYVNASWTLRADLTARYVCRLVNYMDRHRIDAATPTLPPGMPPVDEPLMALSSGYVQRAAANLPRQGARRPWRMRTNYLTDLPAMRLGRIDDGNVRFVRVKERV